MSVHLKYMLTFWSHTQDGPQWHFHTQHCKWLPPTSQVSIYPEEICYPLALFLLVQWADSNLNKQNLACQRLVGRCCFLWLSCLLEHPDIPGWHHLYRKPKFPLVGVWGLGKSHLPLVSLTMPWLIICGGIYLNVDIHICIPYLSIIYHLHICHTEVHSNQQKNLMRHKEIQTCLHPQSVEWSWVGERNLW